MCIFPELTGYLCPLCGMTRAYESVAAANFVKAFEMNPMWPLVPFMLASVGWAFLWQINPWWRIEAGVLRLPRSITISKAVYSYSFAAILIVGVLRNTALWEGLPLPPR